MGDSEEDWTGSKFLKDIIRVDAEDLDEVESIFKQHRISLQADIVLLTEEQLSRDMKLPVAYVNRILKFGQMNQDGLYRACVTLFV